MKDCEDAIFRRAVHRPALSMIALIVMIGAGCDGKSPVASAGVTERSRLDLSALADSNLSQTAHELYLLQELVNDAPIGPGTPQPSSHCPIGPGTWIQGSGRSTATSSVFGDLTQSEVYCIHAGQGELTGGLATWVDSEGDSISMSFGARLLKGFAYAAAPNAPLIGHAQFTGGTGKWSGLTGAALIIGRQNGDGTATLEYRGTVYLPR